MNLVSLLCGGAGDRLFGTLRDEQVPRQAVFGAFAGVALLSGARVLLIQSSSPRAETV